MQIHQLPSPNHAERVGIYNQQGPKYMVIHYSGMQSAEHVLRRLCTPRGKDSVSAHYFIEQCGRITQLVDEDRSAWHAGDSRWRGESLMNSASIGIELDNRSNDREKFPYPDAQIHSLIDLATDIKRRHNMQASAVLAHSDIAPARKADPGELFPWVELAGHGLGLYPAADDIEGDLVLQKHEAYDKLGEIGYFFGPPADDLQETMRSYVVTSFQRHFLPCDLGKGLTAKTRSHIQKVADAFNEDTLVLLPAIAASGPKPNWLQRLRSASL